MEHHPRVQLPILLQQAVSLPSIPFSNSNPQTVTTAQQQPGLAMEIDDDVAAAAGGDLENELREFLESGSGLHAAASSSSVDDNNLMAQLLMN